MASAVFISEKVSERVMYPWPIGDFDNAMDVALDAAMNYLERTGQAQKFVEVQRVAAMANMSGGDNISSYTGTYVQDGDKFAATIAVTPHTQGPPSVFAIDNV